MVHASHVPLVPHLLKSAFCCWLLGTAALLAAESNAPVPPAPVNGLADDARLLSDEATRRIAQAIADLKAESGVSLYVDTQTFLVQGETTTTRARLLREAWVGEKPGLVMSQVRSGASTFSMAFSPALWTLLGEPHLVALQRRVSLARGAQTDNSQKLEAGLDVMVEGLRELAEKSRARPGWGRAEWTLACGFLLLAGVGALLVWFIGGYLRRREAAQQVTYFFPSVSVAERLGAPHGGGVVAQIHYGTEK